MLASISRSLTFCHKLAIVTYYLWRPHRKEQLSHIDLANTLTLWSVSTVLWYWIHDESIHRVPVDQCPRWTSLWQSNNWLCQSRKCGLRWKQLLAYFERTKWAALTPSACFHFRFVLIRKCIHRNANRCRYRWQQWDTDCLY